MENSLSSYWVCVVARNAAAYLASTLESLLGQTLQPVQIVVVNDGSTDSTSAILADYEKRHPRLGVLTLPNNGYDIRRVPRNINRGWRLACGTGVQSDYFMISGDDCSYPRNYAGTLVSRMMAEPSLVVSSGRPRSREAISREHSPSGSGRMVRSSFWKTLGGRYPVQVGWETWLLYKAEEEGFEVRLFDDLVFEHKRPRGTMHQFAYWGAAMHALGYQPIYACGRIGKNLIERNVSLKGSLNMLRGYLQGFLGSSDPFLLPLEPSLRRFVRIQQSCRVVSLARSILMGWGSRLP